MERGFHLDPFCFQCVLNSLDALLGGTGLGAELVVMNLELASCLSKASQCVVGFPADVAIHFVQGLLGRSDTRVQFVQALLGPCNGFVDMGLSVHNVNTFLGWVKSRSAIL